MAKEFKHFDTMFSKAEIEDCRKKWLYNGSTKEDRMGYKRWDRKVDSWTNDFIRSCVYLVSDSLEWQLFRVSLKGLETSEKLYMLDNRYQQLVDFNASDTPTGEQWTQYKIQKCRIDNYILALVRGGQLNSSLEVVR